MLFRWFSSSRPGCISFAALLLGLSVGQTLAATNLSAWVYPGSSGRLIGQPDALGNRIVDGSGVGFKSGLQPLPSTNVVPVKVTIFPVAGDNTANIQNAINQVAAMPMNSNGFRGAVLLSAGEYPCASSINLNASGVVLRGVGSFTNGSGTVLRATASNQYSLVRVSGAGSASTSTTHNITNNYVPVGARSFSVDSTSGFAVGDSVYVRRYTTANWIHDIGMDLLTNAWTPAEYTVNMDRTITRIEGNRVFIDDPVTCAIDRHYTNGALVKFTFNGRITNSGIEHIYGKSDFFGNTTNENHGWIFVQFNSVENGFARDLVSQYFGYSCVALMNGSKHVTVQDCQCLDPVSIITGGRRYGFVMDDDVLCLVKNCYTRQDRHQFVTQSMTTGPNVFVDGLSDSAHAEAGPHHRWATAAIWDKITVNGHDLDAQNTCESGTGHGWEGANCVIWNSKANNLKVSSPPTARNWLIGSIGTVSKGGDCHGIVSQLGTWDSSGSSGPNVFPDSLYFAQLQDRLAAPNLRTREYWLGIIDGFSNSIPRDVVDLDLAWSNVVQTAAAGQPLDPFNVVASGHWIPFTFNYSIGVTDRVVGATLSVAMRASVSASSDVLYLRSITNGFAFSNLGWLPIGTGTNTTVRVMDLGGQLNLLTNGQLNAAIQGDAGIDWAMLELQVAPAINSNTNTLIPVADATVRAGTSGGINFGTAPTLSVKNDAITNDYQAAYMRWDLSGVTQTVVQARVVLTPVSVGTSGIEQGVKVATSNGWVETAVAFNNQPGAGERFATWIPSGGTPVTFDVTPQVLDALNNDRQLSLQLYPVRNAGSSGGVDYASREAVNPATRPQLQIVTLGAAPTISDITNLTVPVNGTTGPLAFTIGDTDTPVNSLLLSGASSNTNVVPNENIIFGGSGANRTVTVTPAFGKSGVATITITVSDNSGLSTSDNFTLTVSSHAPGTFVWNGPGAGANNWSTSGNWLPAGPPEALDSVKFFDAGAVAIGLVNNAVDASFGGEVASLQYGNTNGNHTTVISSGQTLLLSGAGGLVVGTETDNGSTQQVFATVAGNGGALVINNPSADLVVRQGDSAGGSQRATLDLSGLDEFDAAIDQILIGFAGPVIRSTGTLNLARTNNIVATGAPGICVGDNGSNGGGQNFLFLGQENSVFTDSIVVGRRKANSTMKFKAGLANPTAYFRASDGVGPIASWSIGDGATLNASSSTMIGTNDFSGGTVDALVDTLTVGRSQQTSGGTGVGVLTYTGGIFNVNTLQIGFQTQAGSSAGTGFVTLNGSNAVMSVNNILTLGACGGAQSTNVTRGVLNIFGGLAGLNGISVGPGSGANAVAVSGGTLAITNTAGSPGFPIHTVSLTNSSLQLILTAGSTNIVASSLVTGGASNVVTISALTGVFGPGQFPLIQYAGAIGGTGFNFKLGAFAPDVVAGAYLSNNAANSSVDLVITNLIIPEPFLTWDGTVSGDWDAETANWKNNVQSGLVYAEGEDVMFNDSATGPTVVNLTDALNPGSVTVSNNVEAYTFMGSGSLSGTMALAKMGNGTLMLANVGSNDFTGGVTINGGALWVGDGTTNGNLPVGNNVANNGSLVFNRADDIAVTNIISGVGSLTNNGAGTLTLSGANTFAGGTTVNAGAVRPATATSLGSGAVVVNHGELVASAAHTNSIVLAGGTLGTSVTFTNTQLTAAAGTTSIVSTADPQNPMTSLNLYVGGALHGSGTLVVVNATNVASVDGNQGFRLIGVSASDFTGTLALSNNVKGELQIASLGTFSPAGSGRIILSCGSYSGTNGLLGPTAGGYSELNLRNNSSGDGVLGNNVELAGNGLAVLNPLGSAPVGAKMTMGNLKIGGGQELAVYLSSGNTHVIAFQSVTLTGGDAKFLPKSSTFGSAAQVGSDLTLGPISELATGSGIIMGGLRTLTLTGFNSYSGSTMVNSGVLALTNSATIASSTNIVIAAGATLNVVGRGDGSLTLVSGQALQGGGSVVGNLTGGSGSILSPGVSNLATLSVSGSASLNGTTRMELNRAAATNDVLQVAGALNYGGTLAVTNLGGALTAGDAFRLFNAGSYSGAFASITPATPAPGLVWDASQLVVSGTLKVAVAATPVIASAKFDGTNVVLGGTNGPRNGTYWLRASSDLNAPVNIWPILSTNAFDPNGAFNVTNLFNPGTNLFYLLQLQ